MPSSIPTSVRSSVEDVLARDEIRELASRYAVALDGRDLDALVALFVTDVQVGRDAAGHAALRSSFEASLAGVGVTILQVGTQVVDLDDADHAHGVVYCTGEIQEGDRWIRQAILYRDTYRREGGAWRFVRRVHELFYGVEQAVNPLDQPPANWPASSTGRGSVPAWAAS